MQPSCPRDNNKHGPGRRATASATDTRYRKQALKEGKTARSRGGGQADEDKDFGMRPISQAAGANISYLILNYAGGGSCVTADDAQDPMAATRAARVR